MSAKAVKTRKPTGFAAIKARALAGDEAAARFLVEMARKASYAARAKGTQHRWTHDEAVNAAHLRHKHSVW